MLSIHQKILQNIFSREPKDREDFVLAKRRAAAIFKLPPPANQPLLKAYHELLRNKTIQPNALLAKFLVKREIRTLSGIAAVAVLTKPYPCPGKCAYCPTEKDVPQSYLSNEPAVMRAILNKYDPFDQVTTRLAALVENGHEPTKIELIVIGGTWSYLPKSYQTWFIKRCFEAANQFDKKQSKLNRATTLEQQQKINESTKYRIIGITLETRPDYITHAELQRMRKLGCTRVEIGVQHIDDNILEKNNRGHLVTATINASKLLREYGFKITYHLMPGLPGSTPKKDLKMFKQIFSDPNFQPDQIKIYPTVVTQGSLLYKWWQTKKYRPYSPRVLFDLLLKIKKIIPPYVRIVRLIRDIPEESIHGGNKISNLRQALQAELHKQQIPCQCIRCREAKSLPAQLNAIKLITREYPAADGQEYFLSFESRDEKTIYAFLRLYCPDIKTTNSNKLLAPLKSSAIIREVHTYGQLIPVDEHKKQATQHLGLGKKLMAQAEKIAAKQGVKHLAVIAGVGTRNYYRKLGYKPYKTYMVKGPNYD